MGQELVNKLAEVQIWDCGIDFSDEIFVKPMRLFNLEAYTLSNTGQSEPAIHLTKQKRRQLRRAGRPTSIELSSSSGRNKRNLYERRWSIFSDRASALSGGEGGGGS